MEASRISDDDCTRPVEMSTADLRGKVLAGEARARCGALIEGRYEVKEQLGQGGAGVVHRARDRELNRDVAIKFVRTDDTWDGDSQGRAKVRLQREAQAAAQLSHPNVVTVYDVGVWEDDVFVAMELVPGADLRKKLVRHTLSWREVLTLFIPAGRGLAAAHAIGLVHRDFKPGNVLIGEDGRVCVADFGLAKDGGGSERPPSLLRERISEASIEVSLTEAGVVVGTPGYMAPEQLAGRPLNAQCDQFAFCVSLYFGLCGVRPFGDADYRAMRLGAHRVGPLRPPVPGRVVPRWLLRCLARGLRLDPARRWPSMTALLSHLETRSRPRRTAAWGVGGLLLVAAGFASWAAASSSAGCTTTQDWVAEVWNDQARKQAALAFNRSELPGATQTWATAEALVNNRVEAWAQRRTAACAGVSADPLMDARLACFDSHRRQLKALTVLWRDPDLRTVARGATAAAALGDGADCLDDTHVRSAAAGKSEDAVPDELLDRLASARAWIGNGEYRPAVAVLATLVEEAEALGHPSLLAQSLVLYGHALHQTGEVDEAQAVASRGYFLATDLGLYADAFSSAIDLASIAGDDQADEIRGQQWIRHARGAMLAGQLGPSLQARLAQLVGEAGNNPREAEAAYRKAIALTRGAPVLDTNQLARIQGGLSEALFDAGDYAGAEAAARESIAVIEGAFGDAHPWLSPGLRALSSVLSEQGRADEAIALAQRRVEILEASEEPTVARALDDLGIRYLRAGRPEQARAPTLRALALCEAKGVRQTRLEASLLLNLGLIAAQLGQPNEALDALERSAALCEQDLGPESLCAAGARFHQTGALMVLGRVEEARQALASTMPQFVREMGDDHPDYAVMQLRLGEIEERLGNHEPARVALERANSIIDLNPGVAPTVLPRMRFRLAATLWHWPEHRDRALQLAGEALQLELALDAVPAGTTRKPSGVEAWLVEHASPPPTP